MKKLLILCVLGASPLVSASSQQELEGISEQVPQLWQDYRPLCEAGFDVDTQLNLGERLLYLDNNLTPAALNARFRQSQRQLVDANSMWNNESWSSRWQQERAALAPAQREALRDYFFKVQEQKPSGERETLVRSIARHSIRLNLALREGLWKTCYALDKQTQGDVLEQPLEERWQEQRDKVSAQLEREINAFYLYAFRAVPTANLREYARLEDGISAWTDLMEAALRNHFAGLRNQLVAVPFMRVETVAGPLPEEILPLQ